MRAVLTDLDRTLTDEDLKVSGRALDAVDRLRARGVAVGLVTGRPMQDLAAIAPRFDAVVAENGAVVRANGHEHVHGAGFPALASKALGPIGREVAWRTVIGSAPVGLAPYLTERLHERSIGHALIRNADEVMLLPPGVHKGRGALRALQMLGIPPADALGIGDNDNDIDLFRVCGRGVAVANASPHAARAADEVLPFGYAEGFVALADRLLAPRMR